MNQSTSEYCRRIIEIFDKIEKLAQNGEFERVDILLEEVNISETTTSELIAYLTVTLVMSRELKFRDHFFESVDKELRSRPEWNEKLLYGLK
jgi:hypothetical protein